MNIVLMPVRQQWYVQSGKGWYTLETQSDVDFSLTVLPLLIVDEYAQIDQPPLKGSVSVGPVDDGVVSFAFKDVAGAELPPVSITLDETVLCDIEWQEQPFRDGWVRNFCSISVGNASEYSLKIFIPAIEGIAEKQVTVENKSAGTIKQYSLLRGSENTLPLVEEHSDQKQEFILRCEAEPLNKSVDARELGFVLVDEVLAA